VHDTPCRFLKRNTFRFLIASLWQQSLKFLYRKKPDTKTCVLGHCECWLVAHTAMFCFSRQTANAGTTEKKCCI